MAYQWKHAEPHLPVLGESRVAQVAGSPFATRHAVTGKIRAAAATLLATARANHPPLPRALSEPMSRRAGYGSPARPDLWGRGR